MIFKKHIYPDTPFPKSWARLWLREEMILPRESDTFPLYYGRGAVLGGGGGGGGWHISYMNCEGIKISAVRTFVYTI